MLTKFKEKVRRWLAVEAKIAHEAGLTPNNVSAFGMLFAVLSAFTYGIWQSYQHWIILVIAPILLLFSGFCDALDGAIARLYGQATQFGGFLDSLLDRYADAFVFCGIIVGGLCDVSWGLAALIGSLLVSYTRARAEAAGVKMESIGLAERAERIIILAAASLLAVAWLETLNLSIIVLAILTNLTVLQRVVYFYKNTRRRES